jgi:hypothetical protein
MCFVKQLIYFHEKIRSSQENNVIFYHTARKLTLVKVKQSHYRPGQALRFPGD